MAGYQRQSSAGIVASGLISAADHNAEFNAIQTAFGSGSGHTHSGAVGEGGLINYNNLTNRPTVPSLASTTPAALAASGSVGVSTTAARSDHVHPYPTAAAIGAATSSHTHSDATASVAGFMTAAQFTKLAGIATGAQAGTVTSIAAGTGMTFTTITTSGTIAVDTTVVAVKNATQNWANNIQQNMVIMGEGYPVVAKGSVSGSVTCDLSTGSFFTMSVGSSGAQVTFSNAKSGRAHVAYLAVSFTASPSSFGITGDLARGSPAPWVWNSASANSQSWSTSGTDILQCITFNGGTSWYVIRLVASPT